MIKYQLKASGACLGCCALLTTAILTQAPQSTAGFLSVERLVTVLLGMLWSLAIFDLLTSSYLYTLAPVTTSAQPDLSAQRSTARRSPARSLKWLSIKWALTALGGGLWYIYGEATIALLIGLSLGLIIFGWSLHASSRVVSQPGNPPPSSI